MNAGGLILAAPRSGSGKTLLTLGLIAALARRRLPVAPAKVGPDYIDAAILARVAGRPAVNLDPWAMSADRLRAIAARAAADHNLLLVEGVMGLFDGAADGTGSTADLAAVLGFPVVLVVDAERQSQSVAALVHGFAIWRADLRIGGVILNRVASVRHEAMLRAALEPAGMPVLGCVPRRDDLHLPDRHLGLVLPGEVEGFDIVVAAAAAVIETCVDIDALLALRAAGKIDEGPSAASGLAPLGQRIAIARDDAFAFLYPHWLADWRAAGAEPRFFSPLADEAPPADADAVLLPGGYPELHAGRLAAATGFMAGLRAASERGALIYGECGGYMVLGDTLTDRDGTTWPMAGLLPVATRIDRPRRVLGYRRLTHAAPLPWPAALRGHEFHYSSGTVSTGAPPLFSGADALGEALDPMGSVVGRVMGSYAHVIDAAG